MFTFCTNYDCKNLLTDYELGKIFGGRTSKYTKFKFCKSCRRYAHNIALIRCVRCRCSFNPAELDKNGQYNRGTIFRMFCDDCTVLNIKESQATKWLKHRDEYRQRKEAKKIAL